MDAWCDALSAHGLWPWAGRCGQSERESKSKDGTGGSGGCSRMRVALCGADQERIEHECQLHGNGYLGKRISIVSGLTEGSKLIIAGHQKLSEGSEVIE